MRPFYLIVAGAVVIAGLAAGAAGKDVARNGDAQAGRILALHECDACHVIPDNREYPPLVTNYAPSFVAIASKPGTTHESLRVFLSHPHAYQNMPYPDLTAVDLADVIAYLMKLRDQK
jgi:cytochrome c2